MERLSSPRCLGLNQIELVYRRGALGIAGLGEIGAVVLLIAILLSVLAGVGLVDGTVLVQDDPAAARARSRSPVESPIYGMDIAHAPETMLVHRRGSVLQLCDLRTGSCRHTGNLPNCEPLWIRAVALSDDARRIAVGLSDGSILFRLEGAPGPREVVVSGHDQPVSSLKFSPDGRLVASASGNGSVRIWDVEAACVRHVLQIAECPEEGFTHVAFSPDGSRVVAASRSGPVCCWCPESGRVIGYLSMVPGVRGLEFSPDGESLLIADLVANEVRRVDAQSGQELWKQRHPAPNAHYTSVAPSPDGEWVAAGDHYGNIHLLDAATGEIVGMFEMHDANISSLEYSPDGSILYSASHDGRVGVWDSRELTGRS